MIRIKNEKEKEALIKDFGLELGEILYLVEEEVISLCFEWDLYKSLFGTSKERVDILNKALGVYAAEVDESMYDSVLGRISRLTDKSSNSGNENVSINRLLLACEKARILSDAEQKTMDELVKETKKSVKDLRKVRNKMISHTDLKNARADFIDLRRPSRQSIAKTIDLLQDVCNVVRSKTGVECNYFPVQVTASDKKLFYVLEKGAECFDSKDIVDYLHWDI